MKRSIRISAGIRLAAVWAASLGLVGALGGCASVSGGGAPSGLFAEPGQESALHYLHSNQEIEKEIHRDGLVFLGFCQTHCGACKMMKPRVEALARKYGKQIRFVSIDVEVHKEPVLKYKAYKTPDLRLYRDGKQIGRWTGFTHTHVLEAALEKAIKG